MKGLPSICCSCGELLSDSTVLLLCNCLVSICRSCCLKQLAKKPNTYRSHITCPVCGDQQSNVINGIIGGTKEAEEFEEELIFDSCAYFSKISYLRARKSLKTKLNTLRNLEDNFANLGYPRFIESLDSKPSEIVYLLGLYIARCEAQRQSEENIPKVAEDLPWGPLNYITFTPNYTLSRVLAMVAGQEDMDSTQDYCELCCGNLLPGSTVRRMCACRKISCQACVRRTITNLPNTYSDLPARCSFCNQAVILVEDVQKAREAEKELLRDLPQYKSGSGKALLYSLYRDLLEACDMPQTIDFDCFMSKDNTAKIATKAMCTLELARLCQERRRQHWENSLIPSQQLPLGPLAYLCIDQDVFLEAFLVFLNGPAPDTPKAATQVLGEPLCCFDEATNLVRQSYQPGGDLSEEVATIVEAERLMVAGAEDQTELGRNLSLLLRSVSTPCTYEGCSVNPQCPVYLNEHIARHHICSIMERVTPVTTPASRRRSHRPRQAPLEDSIGTQFNGWDSGSTTSTTTTASTATMSGCMLRDTLHEEEAEEESAALSSEDEEEVVPGREQEQQVGDATAVDSEEEVEEVEEGVPPICMGERAVFPVLAADRSRPGQVFRALQPAVTADRHLPAQLQRRSTLPVPDTTVNPSRYMNSQSSMRAATPTSLPPSAHTSTTAVSASSLVSAAAAVHRIKRKADAFMEDEAEVPVQSQQHYREDRSSRTLHLQRPPVPSARTSAGRTLADAVSSTVQQPTAAMSSHNRAATLAEWNRNYNVQVEADGHLAVSRVAGRKVSFASTPETRVFGVLDMEPKEEQEDGGIERAVDDEEDAEPPHPFLDVSDQAPQQLQQSALNLNFFLIVDRVRSSDNQAACPFMSSPPPPPPSLPPQPDANKLQSVLLSPPAPPLHPPLPIQPPPPADHLTTADDIEMRHPSRRADLGRVSLPYGTPYTEDQPRYLGQVLRPPEEAWQSDEAYQRLQNPDARRFELVFEQETPPAGISCREDFFLLKYPVGVLKTSAEAVPSTEEGFFVVPIRIEQGVQAQLKAVLVLLKMHQYHLRGSISKWVLAKSNNIRNNLRATKTFRNYKIPLGSRIVLRELAPEVEQIPAVAPFKRLKPRKRMTNAQYAVESDRKKRRLEEEALRAQRREVMCSVKAEPGRRTIEAGSEEGELSESAREDVTLVDSGSNHSDDRTLSDDGVSESSSILRRSKPALVTPTNASAGSAMLARASPSPTSASRKRSRWDAESAVSRNLTGRHSVSPPGAESSSQQSSIGMTVVAPAHLLAMPLAASAELEQRSVRPKLTKEALSSLQAGINSTAHNPDRPLSPLQASQMSVSAAVSTSQQISTPSPPAQPQPAIKPAAKKSRFGTDDDFAFNLEDLESSSTDSEAEPNPTGKRKGGMRKPKLPMAQRRTGSTNASGITNGNHRPPIYFDRSVEFATAAAEGYAGQSQSGMRPVSDLVALGQSQSGMRPVSDLAALGQSQSGMRPVLDLAALERSSRAEQGSVQDRHSDGRSDDRYRTQRRYSGSSRSGSQGTRNESVGLGDRWPHRSPRTVTLAEGRRTQYRDNFGHVPDIARGPDRNRQRQPRVQQPYRPTSAQWSSSSDSVGWSIDRGSRAQQPVVLPAQSRAGTGEQQPPNRERASPREAGQRRVASQEELSWQARPCR